MKKIKKSGLLFPIFASLVLSSTPILTSCSSLQYTRGEVIDSNSNANLVDGNIPEEFIKLQNDEYKSNIHLNVVNNKITYKDYEKPSYDANGVYQFINQRGPLVDHTLNSKSPLYKDEFLKIFDYYKYVNDYNNSITQDEYNEPIVKPSSELFIRDIYSFIIQIYASINKSINVQIVNKNLNYSFNNNVVNNTQDDFVEFDFTFKFTNIKTETISLDLFNKKLDLIPNKSILFKLKANKQIVYRVINSYNDNFFLGWIIKDFTLFINDNVFYKGEFNPTQTGSSFAFPMEFLNLSDKINYQQKSESSQEFLNNLSDNIIKNNIETQTISDINSVLNSIPELANIFNSLNFNPTLGKFLYDFADSFYNIFKTQNVLPNEALIIVKELLQSIHTGKGIIDVLYENKNNMSVILKVMFKEVLWNLTDLIDVLLEKIKPNMTYDEILGFKSTINLFLPDGNPIKNFIIKLVDVLLGQYENGVLVQKGNPYILDLVDWLVIDNFSEFNSLLKNLNVNIDEKVFKAIIDIYVKLTERNKDANGKTDVSKGSVNFNNPILDKLLEIKTNADGSVTWWLMDNLIIILNGLGVNVGTDDTNILYSVLHQIYSLEFNKNHFNLANLKIAINEISNVLNYLSNKNNYKITKEYSKINNLDVSYDKNKHILNFTYKIKIIFTKPYTFNIENILQFLPSDIFLELSKLLNQDSIQILQPVNLIGQYVRLNLERLVFSIFPKRVSVGVNDAYVTEFSSTNKEVLYSQKNINGVWYDGFSTILNKVTYFEQAQRFQGIISSALSSILKKEYYSDTDPNENNSLNKYLQSSNLGVDIKYESGADKQTAQSLKIGTDLVAQLFANKTTSSIILDGYDASRIVGAHNNSYYLNKTFKWLDTDLDKELFAMGSTSNFKSVKFDEYRNMIKYKDLPKYYDYNYVSNADGFTMPSVLRSKEPYIHDVDKNKMMNDLFTIGTGIDSSKLQVSINPIINFDISKTINLKVKEQKKKSDGSITEIDWTSLGEIIMGTKFNIDLSIHFYVYKIDVLLPEYVLFLENENSTSFNNKFTKYLFAPRVAIKTPEIKR